MPSANFSGLQKGLMGLFGAILVPVAIFAIEQWITKPPTPTPPTAAIISLNGQVIDRSANRLLEGVAVQVKVSTYWQQQTTDSLGRYAFSIEGFDPRLSGSIQASAPGYKPVIYNESLQEMTTLQSLDLDALPEPTPEPSHSKPAPLPGKPAITSHPLTARYVPRLDAQRFTAQVHR
jgi:hypothetical protein